MIGGWRGKTLRILGQPHSRRGVWIVLTVTGLLSGLGAFTLNAAFPEWRLIHYPLHAAVESVGAFAALIVALLILGLRNHGHLGTSYTWVASALIGMGFLDALHSLHHAGEGFVWLHSLATFVGGMVFMGVWLSDRASHQRWMVHAQKGALGLAAVLGAGSIAFPELIPEMVVDGGFSPWARATNITGGIGFLIASLYFATGHQSREDGRNRIVFSSHCFLFGLSGVIFEFSVIWDAAWWLWHALRICAYMIALSFYFNLARSIERELYVLKQHLEQTVVERTASLNEEAKLRQRTQATLRKIGIAIDQSPILVFITDAMGIIEYVNPKFEQITGYSREEVIGQTPRIIKSADTPREIHEEMWQTILAGKNWTGEIKDRAKNGETFWASAIISPVRNESNSITHFVAMHEDITARKLAEEATQEAHKAAELSNKAKTDLLANMSHELRTPLNAIIGFADTMKHGVFGPLGNAKYEEYADYIHSSGTHLLHLINDILDVSAVEAGKLTLREENASVAGICDMAIRILHPMAERGRITLKGIDAPDLPLLFCDPLRLKQIFINLISNAVKFTHDFGAVSCAARVGETGEMIITVTDTGIGMDEEGLVKAMSKFEQVDSSLSRKHEGTGLGLPLTKGLVELHGGVMELDSAPGAGTTVTLRFPPDRVIRAAR